MNKTKTKKAQSTSTRVPQESLINAQRREKLRTILIQKYLKNYGGIANEKLIVSEVTAFLKRDKITDKDMKELEQRIQRKVTNQTNEETLKESLTSQPRETLENRGARNEYSLPNINNRNNDATSVHSNHSRMSGASNLSQFDEKGAVERMHEEEMRDFETINKKKEAVKKLDFSHANNEWDAINMYNKKLFEEEKLNNKIKDQEIKRRTKADLDNQVKQKLKRLYEEKLKAKEYDVIQLKHLAHLNELEEKKKIEIKKRMLKEKENRDLQMRDEYVTKRIDVLKNRKYERQLVKHNQHEIEREKQIALEKKIAEKEALQKTMKDNEIRAQKLLEDKLKQREDDIKIMEDAARVKEKQENERIEYFKRIERNSNSFMSKMVDTVLKQQEDKTREEEERTRLYDEFKNQQADENEIKRLTQIRDNKRMIRAFLDKQCQEKQMEKEYEHQVDLAQARIWKQDTKNHYEHEKEVAGIIRAMNKNNLEQLSYQVREKGRPNDQMTETEKAMNKQLLENASL